MDYPMKKLYVPYINETWQSYKFKKAIFQLIGLRGVIAGHTQAEEVLLVKYATGCKTIVEIGIAEGASALELRQVADRSATVYLIDPFLMTESFPYINFTKLVAHRYVNSCNNANVSWLEDYSFNISKNWQKQIDFLFIDGDHSYNGCLQDWMEWSPFVVKNGIVAFHDGRTFSDGWTTEETGSVRVVNELFKSGNNPNWRIVNEVDSLVVVQRIS
jgi:predicted O-methyltransferase YrrM